MQGEPSTPVHPFARFFVTGRFADALLKPCEEEKYLKTKTSIPATSLQGVHLPEIAVHRVILAAQSPYFFEIFSQVTTDASNIKVALARSPSPQTSDSDDDERYDDAHQGFAEMEMAPSVSKSSTLVNGGKGQSPAPALHESVESLCSSSKTVLNDFDQPSASVKSEKSNLEVFEVRGVDEPSLRLALEWFYFGDLDLNLQTAWGVWATSKRFKVPALTARVEGFIESILEESEMAFAEALEDDVDIMEAAMHITEVRLGEEEWQEALLRAVRVQSPLSILEKLVDAAVRESIWAERCGQLKSFGGREAAFAIVEALTNLRETDSDIGPEPMNQSSENQGSTFTKAFRGFHLIRGLIDEHDNSGDPITDDEMATLFSTLRFDRFRLDELETVHNDSRIPRELVASALMSGLRKREHEMRRTFKTCFQAICAFGLGKNSTRRISGSAFSTVRSNKSDIASQVTKDDITGLDSEDCGTLRVIQLPSAKKVSLGIHEAKGQADGGVIVKALQEDDALATVRGDRQGRLKSAVRVRPALRDDMFGGSGGSSSTSSSLVSPPSLSDESTDRSIQEVSNDIIESVLSQTPSAVVEESLQGGESNFGRKLRSTVVSRNGTFNQRMLESIREERDEQIPKTPASTITVDRRTKRVALSGLSWTERAQKDMGPPAPTFTKLPRQVSVPELIELAVAKLKDIAEDQKEELVIPKAQQANVVEIVDEKSRQPDVVEVVDEKPQQANIVQVFERQLDEEEDEDKVPLAIKRHTWAGPSTAQKGLVEHDDDAHIMAYFDACSEPEDEAGYKHAESILRNASSSGVLPTPGESKKTSPKSPRDDVADSGHAELEESNQFTYADSMTHSGSQDRPHADLEDVEQSNNSMIHAQQTFNNMTRSHNRPRVNLRTAGRDRRLKSTASRPELRKEPEHGLNKYQSSQNTSHQPIEVDDFIYDLQPLPPPMEEQLVAPVPPPHRRRSAVPSFESPVSQSPVTPMMLLCNKSMPPTPHDTLERPRSIDMPSRAGCTGEPGDFKINFENPVDLSFTAFADTSGDMSFHLPDTAPSGSLPQHLRTPSERSSSSRSSIGSRLDEEVSPQRVPNPISKKGRKTSVIPSSSLNGETKKVLATVGTWGPSSNPLSFAPSNQSRRSSRPSLNLSTIMETPQDVSSKGSWGMKEAAYVAAQLQKVKDSRTSVDSTSRGPTVVASSGRAPPSASGQAEGGGVNFMVRKSATVRLLSRGKGTFTKKNLMDLLKFGQQ